MRSLYRTRQSPNCAFAATHCHQTRTTSSPFRRQQVFVANWVAERLESTRAHQCNHCPDEWNPADDGTRELLFRHFHYGTRWFQGPEVLKKPPQACSKVSASMSSVGLTAQVNSSPGIGFAQEATDVATEKEAEEEEEEEEEEEKEEAEEEETTATEVAKNDEGKPVPQRPQ